MPSAFPQLVPSHVCLSCDGCCRFSREDSFWRPRIVPEERLALTAVRPAAEVRRCVMADGCLGTTAHAKGRHRCHFFRPEDQTCAVYEHRPFECRIYPVLVGWFDGELKASLHLSCPFVQDHWGGAVLKDYAERVRSFFDGPEGRHFLNRNAALLPDYSGSSDEVEVLFAISERAPDGGIEPAWQDVERDLDAALRAAARPLSEFALPAAAGWQAHFRFELRFIQGVPCLFAGNALGVFLYLPPLGRNAAGDAGALLEDCFSLMEAVNGAGGVSRVENVPESWVAQLPSGVYRARQRGCEYLYRRDDIAGLAGNAYKSKRSASNQARRRFSPVMRAYDTEDAAVCEQLFYNWARRRKAAVEDVVYHQMLDDSAAVHLTMLRQAPRWPLAGRVIEVDGMIRGYTFGYALDDDTFCVQLEVTDLEMKGLAVYLFQQFCADPVWQSYTFVNAMDDSGLPSLARVKRSFRPVEERAVYTVTRAAEEGA